MAEEKVKENEKVETKNLEVVEIPTQTSLVVKDNKMNELYNELALLVKMANDIEEIKEAVLG
jgi:hypothetical protein